MTTRSNRFPLELMALGALLFTFCLITLRVGAQSPSIGGGMDNATLTLVGVLFTGMVTLIGNILNARQNQGLKQQAAVIEAKADKTIQKTTKIEHLVNSESDRQREALRDSELTNSVLLRHIATLTGTTEDTLRAEIAEARAEQSRRSAKTASTAGHPGDQTGPNG